MDVVQMSNSQRAKAVAAYNSLYGEMDRALWCLSRHCRGPLLAGHSARVVETLVWTVKSWWGIQGVERATRARMAQALATLDWSEAIFDAPSRTPDDAVEFAFTNVFLLVARCQSLGVPRREYSLASKVLHWLLPWRIPVYDSFVCKSLGISTGQEPHNAYYKVAHEIFQIAHELETSDSAWLGVVEPRTLLRGIDKCLWWSGGGDAGTAALVSNPWSVVDRLGLKRI